MFSRPTSSSASRSKAAPRPAKAIGPGSSTPPACLKDDGRAAIVLDTGAVTRGSGSKNEDRERNIRKWFVERDWIEGVILLPDNLFYNTTAAGVIVVLNKRKSRDRQGQDRAGQCQPEFQEGQPEELHSRGAEVAQLAELFIRAKPVDGAIKIITTAEAEKTTISICRRRGMFERTVYATSKKPSAYTAHFEAVCANEREVDEAASCRILARLKALAIE